MSSNSNSNSNSNNKSEKVLVHLHLEGSHSDENKVSVLIEPRRSSKEILSALEARGLFPGAVSLVDSNGIVLKDALLVKEGDTLLVRVASKNAHLPPKKSELRSGQSAKMVDGIPEYVPHRLKMWEELKNKRNEENKAKSRPIKITYAVDNSVTEGTSYVTKPFDIIAARDKEKKNSAVVAIVDGKEWDMFRPFENDCTVNNFIYWGSEEGKEVFWHSSSHILGQVLERLFGAHLCKGPAIETGFYYDVDMDRPVTDADFENIKKLALSVTKENQPFERLEMTKDEALELFKHNSFKQTIISEKVPNGAICTAYRCGPLIDLCRGPHLPSTSRVKAFLVTKASSAYWDGHADNVSLQRVYGISFPTKEESDDYERLLKEAAKRDHRKLGLEQELFFFHPLSPGSCFFLPNGAMIYNRLINFIRSEYIKRGFTEVVTPNVYNVDLWKTSGHWQNYQENMFSFGVENQTFALKPMNCPGHCLMFDHGSRSYKELPVRLADFGVLHRNELSGALTGLTRVRRFQQDDAHIFCRPDQVMQEISSCLDFLKHVYSIFGFTFELDLSTRPQKYMGEIADWDKAEESLKLALNNNFSDNWKLNPGDGAFYGPKIDIKIYDALKRRHQCATIQLDFQLPQKFNLSYIDENDQKVRPVIIHRAILGSVERFIGVLTEHVAGKWPFWLSPRQIAIIPVANNDESIMKLCREIEELVRFGGYSVWVDNTDRTLPKKIREAQLEQYNFQFVIGAEEVGKSSVNIRTRENKVEGLKSKDELLPWLKQLESSYQ